MSKKSKDALLRSDRILVGVLAVVLAAASATVAATAAYHPHKDAEKTQHVDETDTPPAMLQNAGADRVKSATADMAQNPQSQTSENGDLTKVSSVSKNVLEKLLREHRCLSEAMYYEARGEGKRGEKAVAEVVFHRLRSGNYGHSICAVVYEGAYRPGCQFTFTCNGMLNQPKTHATWMQAQILAARILTGEEHLNDTTEGAVNYHAVSVNPVWASELVRTVKIGNHIFYRRGGHSSHAM